MRQGHRNLENPQASNLVIIASRATVRRIAPDRIRVRRPASYGPDNRRNPVNSHPLSATGGVSNGLGGVRRIATESSKENKITPKQNRKASA